MRPLENVTGASVKQVLSFAARALASERINTDQYNAIRESALSLQNVVNTTVGESTEAKRALKTVQRRRRRNSQITMQSEASQARKDANMRIS